VTTPPSKGLVVELYLIYFGLAQSFVAQDEEMNEAVDYGEIDDDEYSDEFKATVQEMYEKYEYEFLVGDKVYGTVLDIDEDGAHIDIGAKAAGFIPLSECSFTKLKSPNEVLRVGMSREFQVIEDEEAYGQVILSLGSLECALYWQRIRQMQEEDVSVMVKVESANKGGLLVMYGSYEGFIPVSQFGPRITVDTMEEILGQEIPCKFLEVDEERERLVFSNKRASSSLPEVQGFQIGDLILGTVESLKPYGAFINIGNGVSGLLHVSQISHERVVSVEKILREGDKVKVMVLSQDRERGRVTLTTKKLEPKPGDMLKDPQGVFDRAEEMAASFRQRLSVAQDSARSGGPGGGMLASEDELNLF
jgi:small subunit ribosomal protein S1